MYSFVRVAGSQLSFKGRTCKTCLVLCPRLALVSFTVVAQNMQLLRYQLQSTPSIRKQLHLRPSKWLASSAPGRLPHKKENGGRLLCGRGVFRTFPFIGGVYPGFCPFSLKIARLNTFNTIGLFTTMVLIELLRYFFLLFFSFFFFSHPVYYLRPSVLSPSQS